MTAAERQELDDLRLLVRAMARYEGQLVLPPPRPTDGSRPNCVFLYFCRVPKHMRQIVSLGAIETDATGLPILTDEIRAKLRGVVNA